MRVIEVTDFKSEVRFDLRGRNDLGNLKLGFKG